MAQDFTTIITILEKLAPTKEGQELIRFVQRQNAALQAARLLCANLDNGGQGYQTLVETFRNLHDNICS